jgi:hypothetical protein
MAKNVYRAERVITTVSTGKVHMVDRTFGQGVVDESGFWFLQSYDCGKIVNEHLGQQ